MKKLVLLLFFVISQTSYTQKSFSLEALTGFGFNKNLTVLEEKPTNYVASTSEINFVYHQEIYNFFIEAGVGTQVYFTSGKLISSNFKATTVRLNVPISIGYNFFKKLDVSGGIVISNNKDLDDFNENEKYNIRNSLLFKTQYSLNKKLGIIFKATHTISNIPESYLLNQPSTIFMLGASYKIF